MKYQIRRATSNDVRSINKIMRKASEGLDGIFVADDLKYINHHIEKDAFINIAVFGNICVGFIIKEHYLKQAKKLFIYWDIKTFWLQFTLTMKLA